MSRMLPFLRNVGLSLACLVATGLLVDVARPRAVSAAEEIQVVVDGPIVLSISIDALEQFAETGKASGDLGLVASFFNPSLQENIRQQLVQPIPFDLVSISNIAYSPMGRNLIANAGQVIRSHPDVNGFYGLRAAAIGAAAAAGPDGEWTVLDALRQFPSQSINVNVRDLLALRETLAVYLDYNQAVISAIQQQAEAEALAQPISETLPDLGQPGPYAVEKDVITVDNPALRQTDDGLTVNYDFPVDVYYPQARNESAPILIISHGFGDQKESFAFLAEHLASHGIVAMLPDHVGSDLSYRQTFLEGQLSTLLSPMEFLNRPQEVSVLIDELERIVSRDPAWATRLDLDRIAIMGDSLGGSTALSLAGAEINYERLAAACDQDNVILNIALYLECRAQFLPPGNYRLRDERIRAVVATHPMGGHLYGPEGMAQIDIPLLMISGSNDILSPVVTEQIYPFIWTEASPKYLALFRVGTHFTSKPGRIAAEGIFKALAGEHRDIGTDYAKTLITAFLQTHLNKAVEGSDGRSPYLTAAFGRAISAEEPLKLDIIQTLTAAQLRDAYGRRLPIPIDPPSVAPPPVRDESILAEIERTGLLKVGFRKDAPPLGYLNPDNEWDGYCGDMAIALSDYLAATMDRAIGIELVELTSTLQNRFDLVRDGSVHLECGPNTIRADVEGVTFSQAMLAAGTRFLVTSAKADTINPNLSLADVRLGVLQDSVADALVQQRYPQAELVPFVGETDREDAIEAVATGEIDAFVGDDVLSYAELILGDRDVDNFALVPELPLSCEFYGFILPDDDPEWKDMVNTFLATDAENAVFDDWFSPVYSLTLEVTDYCLNQR